MTADRHPSVDPASIKSRRSQSMPLINSLSILAPDVRSHRPHQGIHSQDFLKYCVRLPCPVADFDKPPPMEARFLISFEGAFVSFDEDAFGLSLDSDGLEASFFFGFGCSSGSSSSTDSYEE